MSSLTSPRQGFIYDTNAQSLLLTQKLNVTFENPSGSGKKVIIEGYSFNNAMTTVMFAEYILMPTTTLPSTGVTAMPWMLDPATYQTPDNVAIFKWGISVTAMSGGVSAFRFPLQAGSPNHFDSAPLTLLPGFKIGLVVNSGIAVTGLIVSINAREEIL